MTPPTLPTPPAAWRVPTLADDPAHALHPSQRTQSRTIMMPSGIPGSTVAVAVTIVPPTASPLAQAGSAHLVECPACRAPFPADMMVDVRSVTPATRLACLWHDESGTPHEMVCSCCTETAHILSRVTRAELARQLGAPAPFVQAMADRDHLDAAHNALVRAAQAAAQLSLRSWP